MRILLWNLHGGYTDSLLSGTHDYLYLPAGVAGSGGPPQLHQPSAGTVTVLSPEQLRDAPPDLVVLQRLEELGWAAELGLRPGVDVPALFVEHNTPQDGVPSSRHPLADRPELTVVHVTHFNALVWDTGSTPTAVVEHGVADPGPRYTGELSRLGFVVNEPVRRWRTTGTDLLSRFADHPVDAFGIDADRLPPALPQCAQLAYAGNLSPEELYTALARRRAYLHLNRWTSLGLSLIQAMMLGLPVLVLDTTEASRAVPPRAGALSTDVDVLVTEAARLLADPDEAAARGRVARAAALERYGIERFVAAWDEVLTRVASDGGGGPSSSSST
ncbi:glycosyltransferase [uncultured Friedmanniella sp.]|uniref:glycosyltransferase n=1 Tax=uncultured Friedmanniella sp. TaxID=335381 RepID=UPI0035CB380E